MVEKNNNKLTLDRPATYQIIVPGILNERWVNLDKDISIASEKDDDGQLITSLIVTVDQAALHGLLRRLYSLTLPLISVNQVEPNQNE